MRLTLRMAEAILFRSGRSPGNDLDVGDRSLASVPHRPKSGIAHRAVAGNGLAGGCEMRAARRGGPFHVDTCHQADRIMCRAEA